MPQVGNRVPTDPAALPQPANRRAFRIDVTLRADPLTAIMLAMVTFISHAGGDLLDRLHARRSAATGGSSPTSALFVFSMTMLVSVSNFVLLYVFWEAVGLCSYLLIGFWFEKPAAAAAGKKAFLVNRIGDFGFALGVFLIWTTFGTLNFHDTRSARRGQAQVAAIEADHPPACWGKRGSRFPMAADMSAAAVGTAICLLLLAGACGKSAQFPLHVWLPDAMEGPTPVSALIHAATMVTAGVYMIARCTPLYSSPRRKRSTPWRRSAASRPCWPR